ncbi:MAG: hypothetical protein ACI4QA_00625 [Candidatus Spyradosoma sp.]
MKLDKGTLFSSLGLSVVHFLCVIVLMKFRPEALSGGNADALADKAQDALMQPGVWVADFMGCISDKPMWWIFVLLNSALWGNVVAFVLRTFFFRRPSKNAD